jgi:hypothetical protein
VSGWQRQFLDTGEDGTGVVFRNYGAPRMLFALRLLLAVLMAAIIAFGASYALRMLNL